MELTASFRQEITSARTILQSDKIVQIFGTETLQDELIDTLSEILEGVALPQLFGCPLAHREMSNSVVEV